MHTNEIPYDGYFKYSESITWQRIGHTQQCRRIPTVRDSFLLGSPEDRVYDIGHGSQAFAPFWSNYTGMMLAADRVQRHQPAEVLDAIT